MCGIAGFVSVAPSSEPESVIRLMADSIRHRGPDGEGFWRDEHARLGHRRLSIIDLAGGAQPMSNEDGRLRIVYNGEIYNHAELRRELERAGHRYKSRSDTETILHAYEEWGDSAVERFQGMFAFALWDARKRELFCARDRLGIKPFYYWLNADQKKLIFASEIKALLEHPDVSARFDRSMLAEHLAFGYSNDERTLFRGVRKLMPGHTLRFDREGRLVARRYWDVPRPETFERRDDEEWVRECRERIEGSVEQRLMSDVPLGMFLSGGVDSSAIAAILKQRADGPVKTYSVGYAEQRYSELSFARRTARSIGTEHREILVSADDFFGALPELIRHEDEPPAWPSSVSLHFVSKLAAEEVKVVLTGEGCDELFAGYSRYRFYLLNDRFARGYDRLPEALRGGVRRFVASSRLLSRSQRRKLQHTFLGRPSGFESLYIDNFLAAFSPREQASLLAGPGSGGERPYRSFLRYWEAASGARPLSRLLYSDLKTYLVELLMKQDRMSMSTSIESRVPFLEHTFVEFAARVPDDMKLRGGGKYIFKRAVEGLIPREIIRRPKMGFPTPLRDWFREPNTFGKVRKILLDRSGLLADCLDRGRLSELLDDQAGGRVDATDRLWRLLNLQIWGRIFLDGRHDVTWNELGR